MTRKLNEADRAAVDLMFDRIHSGNNHGNGGGEAIVVVTGAVSDERLSAVERILGALEQMPAPEPSPDLVVRTLQRVARQTGTGIAPLTGPAGQQFIDPAQPMA
jgi:hypothetical protein